MKKENYSTQEIATMYANFISETGIKRKHGQWVLSHDKWNPISDEDLFNTFLCNHDIDLDVVATPKQRSRKFLMLR